MVVTKRRSWRTLTLAMVAVVALAACGSDAEESGGDDRKVARIGVIVPLQSGSTAVGLGIRNSVDLAINQANAANAIDGWRLEIAAEDDSGKPDVGGAAASKLKSDPRVAAVIGTYNSSVALAIVKDLADADLALVSPANTNDTLTRGTDFLTNPQRPYNNYFRTATIDVAQGGFLADYAFNVIGARNITVVHDGKAYGQGLAASFSARFKADGGTIQGDEPIVILQSDNYAGDVTKIAERNPDLIFYGGEYPLGAPLDAELKKQNVAAPLIGGDGLVDQTYITNATPEAAEGDYGSSVGAPLQELESAKGFRDAYVAAGYKDPSSAYGGLAFDAANVVIEALKKVLPGKSSVDPAVREAVITAIQATDLNGVTGKVAFDAFGDTVTKTITMYKVEGGVWKPLLSDTFKG